MNVLNRVTLKTLTRNKTRTIVTIIGVILSLSMFTAVTTFVSSMQDFMLRSTMATDGDWEGMLSNTSYGSLETVIGSDEVETSFLLRQEGYAMLEGGKNPNKPYLSIQSFDDTALKRLPLRVTEGRLPQTDTEILIPEHVSSNGGVSIAVGETLRLQVGLRQDSEGYTLWQNAAFHVEDEEHLNQLVEKTYTVVGLYKRPGFESFTAPGYTAITRLDPATLTADDTVTAYLNMVNTRNIYETLPALVKATGSDTVIEGYNKELLRFHGIDPDENFNAVLYNMAGVLVLLIMVGSVSLIYNAFAISVSERSKQFGMLSGAGATARQIRHSVLFEALSISVIGIPLGVLAGIGGIGVTLFLLKDKIVNTGVVDTGITLDLAVSVPAVVIAIAVGLVTVLLSAWIPARRAARMSAIDAIRQTNDVSIRSRQVKTSRLTRKLFGIEGDLALKNFKRNRRRYRTTVFSLVISIVLFLSASSFATYMTAGTDTLFITANYDLRLTDYSREDSAMLLDRIAGLDKVNKVSSSIQFYGTFNADPALVEDHLLEEQPLDDGSAYTPVALSQDGKAMLSAYVTAISDAEMKEYLQKLGLDFDEYNDPDQPRAVVIDRQKYMETDGRYVDSHIFKKQDSLEIVVTENTAENEIAHTAALTAGAFADEVPMGAYSAVNTPSAFQVIVSDAVFDRLFSGFSAMNERRGTTLYVQTDDPSQTEKEIQNILTENHLATDGLYNAAEAQKTQADILLVVGVFAYGFIALISLITIANVFNTISTNVNLRRREFAMLKSVGMTQGSFNRMMNFECIFYGLKALLYGLPLALGVTYLIYLSMNNGVNLPFMIPWSSLIFCVACVFLIVFATMMYSMSKVRRENIIDALKNENL